MKRESRPATRAAEEPGAATASSPSFAARDGWHGRGLAVGAALFAITLVLVGYRDGLHAWFAADDFLWLEIGTLDSVLRSFVGEWGHGALWRPLSRVSFYVDLLLFGTYAGPWHLESLLWHAAVVALLVVLLARTTRDLRFALATGAIFALLPMQYESVLWLSARGHPIALCGTLGCLLLLDRFLDAPSIRRLVAACLLLAAGLLAYEAAVYAAPLAVLLVAAHGRDVPWRRRAIAVLAPGVLVALYVALRAWVLAGANLYAPHPPGWYLTTAFASRLAEVATRMVQQIRPSPWWFVAAGVAGAIAAPRTLALAAAGVAVAVVGYLPFSVVDGFGPRFAYAAQAGFAMLLAAALTGLAGVRWLGKPCAALLLVMLLVHEVAETRQIAREWREAGVRGQQALAQLVAAWPDPDPDRPAVVLGAPTGHGRAMIFFTYFDLALGTFHPDWAGFRLPGHVLTGFAPRMSHAIAVDSWRREQERRRRRRLAPLVCPQDPVRTRDVDAFVRALIDCDAVFFTIDRNLRVRKLTRAFVEARLAHGWRTATRSR